MAKFYKATNRTHPKHMLPAVIWKDERALFEFARGPSGFLECETDDPEAIELLREMDYDEEVPPAPGPPPPPISAPPRVPQAVPKAGA
jgi:hypothetical protein